MKSLLLLCVVSVFFIFGYFVMKKLDDYLYNNRRRISAGTGTSALRIAFETPALADSASDMLEEFSRTYPDCELSLFFGTVGEIKRGLKDNKLDLGFIETAYLTGETDVTDGNAFGAKTISVYQDKASFDTIGLPIVPLGETEVSTEVIWKNNGNGRNKYERIFLSQIYDKFSFSGHKMNA